MAGNNDTPQEADDLQDLAFRKDATEDPFTDDDLATELEHGELKVAVGTPRPPEDLEAADWDADRESPKTEEEAEAQYASLREQGVL